MPYGHLIAAIVMTLGVCQGRSSIASFSILTSASRSPSAIAEFLVLITVTKGNFYAYQFHLIQTTFCNVPGRNYF